MQNAVTIDLEMHGEWDGESAEVTRYLSAKIKNDGTPAGSLTATLVRRWGNSFYSACDAESAELHQISCVLFGPNGQARYPLLKKDHKENLADAAGGFLYLDTFSVVDDFTVDHALAFAMCTHSRLGQASEFGGLLPEVVQRMVSMHFRQTDVGAAALRALLTHAALKDEWSVAGYICDPYFGLTSVQVDQEKHRQRLATFASGEVSQVVLPNVAPPAEASHMAMVATRQRRIADGRQFLRAGFQEINHADVIDNGSLLITHAMLRAPPITHKEALLLRFMQPHPAALEQSDYDRALLMVVKKIAALDSSVRRGSLNSEYHIELVQAQCAAKLKEAVAKRAQGEEQRAQEIELEIAPLQHSLPGLSGQIAGFKEEVVKMLMSSVEACIAAGADLTRSCALHCCVANAWPEMLQPLVAMGADINALDLSGNTPLMLEASSITGNTPPSQQTPDTRGLAHLIALGADTNVTHHNGQTALGIYYVSVQGANDFTATFGLPRARKEPDPTVVALLTPSNGPTGADLEILRNLAEVEDEEDEEDEDGCSVGV